MTHAQSLTRDPCFLSGLEWVSRSQIVSQNLRSICDKHTIKLRLEKRVTGKDRKMQQHRGHFEYKAIAYMVDLR